MSDSIDGALRGALNEMTEDLEEITAEVSALRQRLKRMESQFGLVQSSAEKIHKHDVDERLHWKEEQERGQRIESALERIESAVEVKP